MEPQLLLRTVYIAWRQLIFIPGAQMTIDMCKLIAPYI